MRTPPVAVTVIAPVIEPADAMHRGLICAALKRDGSPSRNGAMAGSPFCGPTQTAARSNACRTSAKARPRLESHAGLALRGDPSTARNTSLIPDGIVESTTFRSARSSPPRSTCRSGAATAAGCTTLRVDVLERASSPCEQGCSRMCRARSLDECGHVGSESRRILPPRRVPDTPVHQQLGTADAQGEPHLHVAPDQFVGVAPHQ
jgi:hypothetical protein